MHHTSTLTNSNAVIGTQATILHEIRQQSKNITIYQRDISFLKAELKQIMAKSVEFRKSGTVLEILSDLRQYFENQLSNCRGTLKDISEQLDIFEKVSGGESFRLLFTRINTNMCRRFHTDINSLRLLCTYAGQGTLWLPDEIVNPKAFQTRGNNEQIVKDESQIQQAGTGDVIILKGALYPKGNAVVHRSPTIEESGESRLLLRIDINDFLNF